jgi:hypothetical protein
MSLTPEEQRLWQIFHPYAAGRQTVALSQKTRFVHYTSADAAMKIIRNREVWMRKSTCMNDFMEVEHGLRCLINAVAQSEFGKRFNLALDQIFQGFSAELEKFFVRYIPLIRTDTYITCLSEHLDDEDTLGRLSMWRAYGETTGVALVMNSSPLLTPSDALNAWTTPVAYLSDQEFGNEFGHIADNIENEAGFIKTQDRELIKNYIFKMFWFAAISTKHPGFKEEKEWRVVHCPSIYPSNHLVKDIQPVQGVPQPIYKIRLEDIPDQGLTGINIPALVNRIIIGPTKYPLAMGEAFIDLLKEAGVQNLSGKVWRSEIPLRR